MSLIELVGLGLVCELAGLSSGLNVSAWFRPRGEYDGDEELAALCL